MQCLQLYATVRLVGQLHIAGGIACLFGFNLPPITHHYFFATGPADFWRRSYIYWRDFLTKIFFYPISLLLKSLGMTISLTLASLILFILVWLLHSYQYFWLLGVFFVSTVDILFWTTF